METNWWLVKDEDSGGYIIQNAMSKRKLFARMPHRGEQWAAGVGAAPADHCGTETTWFIVPVSSHANSEEEYDRVMREHLANQDQAGYGFKSQGLRNWSSQSSNVASTAYSDVSSEYS